MFEFYMFFNLNFVVWVFIKKKNLFRMSICLFIQ